ncbi:MAG: ATP-dependent helicase HrpA, partial [Pedosphaera sp.]|nr:ATP-dependent helicase HrpA [Pedosphaera sp.]
FGLTGWTFGDLPERLTVSETGSVPLYAWPGLQVEEDSVSVRLFRSNEAARRASVRGFQRLVELAQQKDLGWLQKDLRALSRFDALLTTLCSTEELQASAFENLKRYVLDGEPTLPLTEAQFNAAVAQAHSRIPGLASQLIDRVGVILQLRQDVLRRCGPAPTPANNRRTLSDLKQLGTQPGAVRNVNPLADDLAALLPKRFLETISFEQLPHLPRYLKALLTRAERAAMNPVKDQERARQLAPYQEALRNLQAAPPKSDEANQQLQQFRWMVEEFKVSLFAQELGTAIPISAKRLDQQLEQVRQGGR